jgi:NAD(P)-binding Rossmann-like domain
MSKLWCCLRPWLLATLCYVLLVRSTVAPNSSDDQGKSKGFSVAIIGGGIAGASAAYTLRQGTAANITLFEAAAELGGRTREATLSDGRVVELGGSIGIAANEHLVHFTDLLGLKRVQPILDESSVGIWDGSRFLYQSDGGLCSKLVGLARCAPSAPSPLAGPSRGNQTFQCSVHVCCACVQEVQLSMCRLKCHLHRHPGFLLAC